MWNLSSSLDRSIRLRLAAGMSVRKIAAALGVATGSVQRRRRTMQEFLANRTCACGRPAGHNGMCHQRRKLPDK